MATERCIHALGANWLAFIYQEIILAWEMTLKDANFSDLRTARVAEFEGSARIERKAFETADACNDYFRSSPSPDAHEYMYFSSEKRAQTQMIFQHLRNAFAHAHFEFDGSLLNLHTLTASGKIKMKGRLRLENLRQYVLILKKGAQPKEHSR